MKNRRITILALMVVVISLAHYMTPTSKHLYHNIFDRLYYLPIIFAAFWFGAKGGVLSAVLISMLYFPHLIFQWKIFHVSDFEHLQIQMILEVVLYNVVGAVTGGLADKELKQREKSRKAALLLANSHEQLRAQSERLMEVHEQIRSSEKLSALGEMAAEMAHEFRNPLGSIKGAAEILKDSYSPEDPKARFFDILIRETTRLSGNVEGFLRFARPTALNLRACRIGDIIGSVLDLTRHTAEKRNLKMHFSHTPDLPSIMADEEKIRQVLLNCVLNAFDAMPDGGDLTVETRVEGMEDGPMNDENGEAAESPNLEIFIRDTGSGIPEADIGLLFNPFFSTKDAGTGLGLTISQKIVKEHDGEITISSIVGRGTTLRIVLPREGPVDSRDHADDI